jgi:hypothetical protein
MSPNELVDAVQGKEHGGLHRALVGGDHEAPEEARRSSMEGRHVHQNDPMPRNISGNAGGRTLWGGTLERSCRAAEAARQLARLLRAGARASQSRA